MSTKPSNNYINRKLQWSGAFLSILCGIHCAALPIILLLAPTMSSQIVNHFWMDLLVIASIIVIGYFTIWVDYRKRHKDKSVLMAFLVGILLLLGSHLIDVRWMEISFALLGGALLAGSQF